VFGDCIVPFSFIQTKSISQILFPQKTTEQLAYSQVKLLVSTYLDSVRENWMTTLFEQSVALAVHGGVVAQAGSLMIMLEHALSLQNMSHLVVALNVFFK
jgi:hypothetical protein